MITTKTCSTCEHFPNDHHCVGCVWDYDKRGNTKWELKENPIVIERKVLDKIRAEIEKEIVPRNSDQYDYEAKWQNLGLRMALKVIDKYKTESEDTE